MQISIENGVYNERRYSKPWIAKVDFIDNKKGNFSFGDFIGEHGYGGVCELENIKQGDIIAVGQKDFRKPGNSTPRFYIVEASIDITIAERACENDYEEQGLRGVSKREVYRHAKKSN